MFIEHIVHGERPKQSFVKIEEYALEQSEKDLVVKIKEIKLKPSLDPQ